MFVVADIAGCFLFLMLDVYAAVIVVALPLMFTFLLMLLALDMFLVDV